MREKTLTIKGMVHKIKDQVLGRAEKVILSINNSQEKELHLQWCGLNRQLKHFRFPHMILIVV
jgi:hypothetical protein